MLRSRPLRGTHSTLWNVHWKTSTGSPREPQTLHVPVLVGDSLRWVQLVMIWAGSAGDEFRDKIGVEITE